MQEGLSGLKGVGAAGMVDSLQLFCLQLPKILGGYCVLLKPLHFCVVVVGHLCAPKGGLTLLLSYFRKL